MGLSLAQRRSNGHQRARCAPSLRPCYRGQSQVPVPAHAQIGVAQRVVTTKGVDDDLADLARGAFVLSFQCFVQSPPAIRTGGSTVGVNPHGGHLPSYGTRGPSTTESAKGYISESPQ